ncbi:MAG: D-aminoacyl-tRNA deacylase [Gammaproteobacteria bacterium]|nr:D-aminoacyl-tRNA deacylase [Gammaproteobacteria bacterium]
MIALIQRVTEARVTVDQRPIGQIGPGILALLGVVRDDCEADAEQLIERLLNYRIFNDARGRMNFSLVDTRGALLLVPQFTLTAHTSKGLRPGFDPAAPPERAKALFDHAADAARTRLGDRRQLGRFGAEMQVALVNSGPVTFWLESSP